MIPFRPTWDPILSVQSPDGDSSPPHVSEPTFEVSADNNANKGTSQSTDVIKIGDKSPLVYKEKTGRTDEEVQDEFFDIPQMPCVSESVSSQRKKKQARNLLREEAEKHGMSDPDVVTPQSSRLVLNVLYK